MKQHVFQSWMAGMQGHIYFMIRCTLYYSKMERCWFAAVVVASHQLLDLNLECAILLLLYCFVVVLHYLHV